MIFSFPLAISFPNISKGFSPSERLGNSKQQIPSEGSNSLEISALWTSSVQGVSRPVYLQVLSLFQCFQCIYIYTFYIYIYIYKILWES